MLRLVVQNYTQRKAVMSNIHPTILAAMMPMMLHMRSEPSPDMQKDMQEMSVQPDITEAKLKEVKDEKNNEHA